MLPQPGSQKYNKRQPKTSTLPTWFHRNLRDKNPNMTLRLGALGKILGVDKHQSSWKYHGSWWIYQSLFVQSIQHPRKLVRYKPVVGHIGDMDTPANLYRGSSKSEIMWNSSCLYIFDQFTVLSSWGDPQKTSQEFNQNCWRACWWATGLDIFTNDWKRFSSVAGPIFKHPVNGPKYV